MTNWGFGVEHHVGGKTTLYGGFITDRSAFDCDSGNLLRNVSSWDIYHLALGSTFRVSTIEFTLGGNYSWADDVVEQLGEVSAPGKLVDEGIRVREVPLPAIPSHLWHNGRHLVHPGSPRDSG